MRIADTKIYLKFIAWFLLVAILPLILLFALLFQFDLSKAAIVFSSTSVNNVLFGSLVTLALLLVLALVAAKLLAHSINNPVQISVKNLVKVVNSLSKSIKNIAEISQTNRQAIKLLTVNTQEQQKNLKIGQKLTTKIAGSLAEVTDKVSLVSRNTTSIDKLSDAGEANSRVGLNSLSAIKQLSTDNQKLNHALADYASQVALIASRVGSMADLAKYLSVNATIEANKSNISEEFSSIVNQIRELNVVSQQAAVSISHLTQDMQRQLIQNKQSSGYELKETDRSINVISQTIKLLMDITKQSRQVSKYIQQINQETTDTNQSAQAVADSIIDLNKESLSIVKTTEEINKSVSKQTSISSSLNRAFNTLEKVVDDLDKIVGKIS